MSGRAGRILVVDDVPENVRLLEAMLEGEGYDVVSTTDGLAALELAVSAKPDLVLLDVMMPPPDGLAVCRQLRKQQETAVLPVIMLTASEGSEKTTAIAAGADDFIPKPFNRDELLDPHPVAHPHQAVPRHDRGTGRGAARSESNARRTRGPAFRYVI